MDPPIRLRFISLASSISIWQTHLRVREEREKKKKRLMGPLMASQDRIPPVLTTCEIERNLFCAAGRRIEGLDPLRPTRQAGQLNDKTL